MTITTEHGTCEKIARMVKTDDSGNPLHIDLASRIDDLARHYMQATGEKNYSNAVHEILRSNSTIRQAYANFTSADAPPSERLAPRPVQKNVSDAVAELAQAHMIKTGEKSLSKAAKAVLHNDPELAERYAAFTCSRK